MFNNILKYYLLVRYYVCQRQLHCFWYDHSVHWHSTTDERIATWMRALTPTMTDLRLVKILMDFGPVTPEFCSRVCVGRAIRWLCHAFLVYFYFQVKLKFTVSLWWSVTGSTRRSVVGSETSSSPDGSDSGAVTAASDNQPPCDDYRPSVASTGNSARYPDDFATNPQQHPSQTLRVPPPRHSANGKPSPPVYVLL